MREWTAISLPQDTDTEIGQPFMIKSWQDPRVMNGGILVYLDKFAVVSGAASGIGRACTERLQDFNYMLQLLDLNVVEGSAIEKIDLSKTRSVIRRAPDLVVVSHGIGGLGRGWEEVIATNLYGVRNVVEPCIERMVADKHPGCIVVIASMTGVVVGNRGMSVSNYAASKGAVAGYVRQRAVEVAPYDIRINAICPGPVVTPMTQRLKNENPDLYKEFFGRCLLPGSIGPFDVADAVLAVAGIRKMTGQLIVVDGGYSIW